MRSGRLRLAALVLAGCGPTTGILVDFTAPTSGPSIASGIASLEVRVAQTSFCGRFVEDPTARVTVDVRSRELLTDPYRVMLRPPHFFDLANSQVYALAVAHDAGGKVIGWNGTGAHHFRLHQVREFLEPIILLARPDAANYVADDGCACFPGESWLGSGSGTGCDLRVVPDFARVIDTRGCDIVPGSPQALGPVCDGQSYDEAVNRPIPCFAPRPDGMCAVTTRTCADQGGVAYASECVPDATATPLGSPRLCDLYTAASREACGDVVGRVWSQLAGTAPVMAVACTLYVDAASPDSGRQTPCGPLTAPIGANTSCLATVLDGVQQPPFKLGFVDPAVAGAQAVGPCPPQLTVDEVVLEGPAQRTVEHRVRAVIANHPVQILLTIVKGCVTGPALVCR